MSGRGWLVAVVAGCVSLLCAAPVFASAPGPVWRVHSFALPSSFSTAQNASCEEAQHGNTEMCDVYEVVVRDAGSVPSDGSTVTLTDTLPAGVTFRNVKFFWSGLPEEYGGGTANLAGLCSEGAVVQCQIPEEFGFPGVAPDDTLQMLVYVTVNEGTPAALVNKVSVSGGGVREASVGTTNQVGAPPSFGFAAFASSITGLDGMPEAQAGAHPYEFTSRFDFANEVKVTTDYFNGLSVAPAGDFKDAVVDLPLGFLGTALATPKCTLAQLSSGTNGGAGTGGVQRCPRDTQVGLIVAPPEGVDLPGTGLYNMVPERGVAAEFGFVDTLNNTHILYSKVVPTPAGYVLRTTSPEIPVVTIDNVEVILFGDPAARDGSGNTPVALFTNPAYCSGEPLVTSIHMDSWQNPGRRNSDGTPDFSDPAWVGASSESPPVTGCDRLQFHPSIGVQPETTTADTPTGLGVELKVPQSEEPGSLATPPLRNGAVTLPAGMTLNPAAASGLDACSEAQIGLGSAAAPSCPEASKIGSVEVETPLIGGTLVGSIYLARQNENPFHTLLAGYIVIDDPTTGTIVKIPGNLTPNPATGQITGSFDEDPQFAVSDLKLHFFGGPRGSSRHPRAVGRTRARAT